MFWALPSSKKWAKAAPTDYLDRLLVHEGTTRDQELWAVLESLFQRMAPNFDLKACKRVLAVRNEAHRKMFDDRRLVFASTNFRLGWTEKPDHLQRKAYLDFLQSYASLFEENNLVSVRKPLGLFFAVIVLGCFLKARLLPLLDDSPPAFPWCLPQVKRSSMTSSPLERVCPPSLSLVTGCASQGTLSPPEGTTRCCWWPQ